MIRTTAFLAGLALVAATGCEMGSNGDGRSEHKVDDFKNYDMSIKATNKDGVYTRTKTESYIRPDGSNVKITTEYQESNP
jgi:hypothetical protein